MATLQYNDEGGTASVISLEEREVLIGRLAECDIVIPKGFVSRRHARIFLKDGHWALEDLNSSHGTYVNRLRVSEKVLEPGDQIQIGDEVIAFHDGTDDLRYKSGDTVRGSMTEKAPDSADDGVVSSQPVDSGDIMRTVLGAQTVELSTLTASPQRSVAQLIKPVAPPSDQSTEPPISTEKALQKDADLARQLVSVFNVGAELRRCTDILQVCRMATIKAMSAVNADRGVLALRDQTEESRFVPAFQFTADLDGDTEQAPVQVSHTMVDRVVKRREALLSYDTSEDAALSAARSVVAQSIRSIVCAPLWDGKDILGYLYLDSSEAGRLRSEHLDLINAIGHLAAAEVARLDAILKLREEEERRSSLARFFSADVVQHIEDEARAGRLDPTQSVQEQVVTILFADIKGFTRMSEHLGADDIKKFLDEYYERMTQIIVERHNATLDKYIGDAIMALFGAPVSQGVQSDARRAIAAAVDMREGVETLRRENKLYEDLHIRIGINTGKVIAGMLGSTRQMNYSVIGDAVNVASRLESAGESGRIQIGEVTYNLVSDEFDCEFAAERHVKNRDEPVKCWWVTGAREG